MQLPVDPIILDTHLKQQENLNHDSGLHPCFTKNELAFTCFTECFNIIHHYLNKTSNWHPRYKTHVIQKTLHLDHKKANIFSGHGITSLTFYSNFISFFNEKINLVREPYLAFHPHQVPCRIYFVDPNIFNRSLNSTHAPRHLFAFKYLSRRDKRSSPLQMKWSNIQQKYVVLYSTRP